MDLKPVARVGDTGSHGGSIISGSENIALENIPIARVGDIYNCPVHGPNPIVTGSAVCQDNGKHFAHVGSLTECGAVITSGSDGLEVDVESSSKGEVV